MATSVRLIRRYVWLVETIRRAGSISLDEINERWAANASLNHDRESEIPDRTFHRHREAIADLFDIEIACDRVTNTYFIKNAEELSRPSFTSWLFNGLALDNQLMAGEGVKTRIQFEDASGGAEHLPMIVESMATNRVVSMTYRSYNRPEETVWEIEPCGLKQNRRRWYLIGYTVGDGQLLTFALDRMIDIRLTDKIFEPTDSEVINELFSETVGVFVDMDYDVEDVIVRVYGKQRRYFESTPLHHSQQFINRTDDYTDYSLRLRPEYEFQHEIMRLGSDAEVLSPRWLRDEMKWNVGQVLKRYETEPD